MYRSQYCLYYCLCLQPFFLCAGLCCLTLKTVWYVSCLLSNKVSMSQSTFFRYPVVLHNPYPIYFLPSSEKWMMSSHHNLYTQLSCHLKVIFLNQCSRWRKIFFSSKIVMWYWEQQIWFHLLLESFLDNFELHWGCKDFNSI